VEVLGGATTLPYRRKLICVGFAMSVHHKTELMGGSAAAAAAAAV